MAGKRKVFVVGIGMTKFTKPGSTGMDYPDLVREAVTKALNDCKLRYDEMQQAVVGYIFGSSCCGQRALYELGMTGIPIFNFDDRTNPVDKHVQVVAEGHGLEPHPMMAQFFGNAGREHMKLYGSKPEHFAKIGWKNHKHSVNNPNSQFQKEFSLEQVKNAKMIHDPLTLLQCSPTSDGSAAAVLCSEDFLRAHPHLKDQVGFDSAKATAEKVYRQTGLGPTDVQLIECHDCFSANELITYEALGLCPIGKAAEIVDRGDNTYGGRWVVNPSGGLISKGHPIGATGVAQCVELSLHLRGQAGKRQVPNARVGLQHNIGIGGACFIGMYKLGFPKYESGTAGGGPGKALASGPQMQSDIVFETIRERAAAEGAEIARRVASSYRFVVSGGGGAKKEWTLDLKAVPLFVGQREGKVDCEILISDENMMKIASGELKPDQAFMQGKMKLKGNVAKAMKLREVLDAARTKAKL